MSARTSIQGSRQSSSDSASKTRQQYSFVDQSENINASKTRRAVRSHAMRAVRRQQRQESLRNFRLKWPDEYASSQDNQQTSQDEQLSGIEDRQNSPQLHGRKLEGSQGRDSISGTNLLASPEPARRLDEDDPLRMDVDQISNFLDPRSEGPEYLYPLGRNDSSQYTTMVADEEATRSGTNARTFLGAGRVDPFQTFPVQANRSISELVDHCTLS